ncbi:MAG TPA: leucyl/phenylalanyl-tRNA--protein transferase [Desulfobacterales bacterium]|nr:leucyl/phenylalanyl-tRNA--protein transferase [Desulfobacterales bacterium]
MPVFNLSSDIIFPPPELAREDGLLAVGGDLTPERLLMAYQMGIFPWYSDGEPILWWSPVPRLIMEPAEFHLSKRLARELRRGMFEFSFDRDFRAVIESCAVCRLERGEPTWITEEMIEAYCRLHELGFAHSVECRANGELVGGLYGVAVGALFCGESMFSLVSNSSKAAMAVLCRHLRHWGFDFIDCQMRTTHLVSLGAKEISGPEFFYRLQRAVLKPRPKRLWLCRGFTGSDQLTTPNFIAP